ATYNDESIGIFAETGSYYGYGTSATTTNAGTIYTYGEASAGMVATAYSATAINTEDGVISVHGDASDGMLALAYGSGYHAYAANYGTVNAFGDTEDGFNHSDWIDENGPDINEA